jgi:hypothetical protein
MASVIEDSQFVHGDGEDEKVESVDQSVVVGGWYIKQGDSPRASALVITPVFQPADSKLSAPSEQ